MSAIVRAYIMYKPRKVFYRLALLFLILGLIPFVRFLVLAATDGSSGHLQSLIVGAVGLFIAFLSAVLGIVADLIHINRILLEENLEHTKHLRFNGDQKH